MDERVLLCTAGPVCGAHSGRENRVGRRPQKREGPTSTLAEPASHSPVRANTAKTMARRAPDPASVAAAAPPTTVEPQPAASAAAAALAPSPSVRDSLDVEHYVPRVPLQLVAVAFALAAPALAPRAAVVPRPAEVLAVYVRDPVQSLSVAAALVAVVQVWFGYWARSCRAGAAHLRRQDAQRSAATRRLERSRTAARRTAPHGFRAVLGHIWNNPVGEWATPEGEAAVAGQPTLVGGIDYSVSPPHFSRLFFWGGGGPSRANTGD